MFFFQYGLRSITRLQVRLPLAFRLDRFILNESGSILSALDAKNTGLSLKAGRGRGIQSSETSNLLSFSLHGIKRRKEALAVSEHSGKQQDSCGSRLFSDFFLLYYFI